MIFVKVLLYILQQAKSLTLFSLAFTTTSTNECNAISLVENYKNDSEIHFSNFKTLLLSL